METVYRSTKIRIPEDPESRRVQFVISDGSKDRYRTVLSPDSWNLENFNNNGIVGYQHDVYGGGMCNGPDPDSVIGKGRAWVEQGNTRNNGSGKVLMGEVEFEPEDVNPLAEKVFKKVRHGTLNATSVGFRPIGGGKLVNDETGQEKRLDEVPYQVPKGHTFHFDGQELLEFSVVNIPANPNALKKNLRNQTANALHFVKRQLGIPYGDIEEMKVRDVIEMLEKGESPKKTSFELDTENSLTKIDEDQIENTIKESKEESQFVANGLRDIQMRKLKQKKAINKIG